MKNLSIIAAFAAVLALVACNKEATPVPEHQHTEQELKKQKLGDALDVFFEKLDPASIENASDFVAGNSQVALAPDGSIVYRLKKDDITLIYGTFLLKKDQLKVDIRLYGGPQIKGDSRTSLDVYLDGEKLATLGIEWMDLYPLAVLRYPDGTSYALSSFLVTGALLDYLMNDVLSTE